MRASDVAAAVLAAGLALAAVPSIRAEWVYGSALGYGAEPSDDAPGRLEAYERAAELDPRAPIYALRAGDLRVRRAATDAPNRDAHLEAALIHYRRAVSLAPLDPRMRAGWAQALAAVGATDDALVQNGHVTILGPCWQSVLARAMLLYADTWERTGDPALLADAFRTCRSIADLSAGGRRRLLGPRLFASTRDVQGDILEALAREPELMREAAHVVERQDAVLAATLRELAGPEEPADGR